MAARRSSWRRISCLGGKEKWSRKDRDGKTVSVWRADDYDGAWYVGAIVDALVGISPQRLDLPSDATHEQAQAEAWKAWNAGLDFAEET